MKEKIEIAVAADSNYLVPVTVLLKSIFENNKEVEVTVNLLYLYGALKEQDIAWLQEYITNQGHILRKLGISEEQLGEVPECRHSKSTFLRLFLPAVVPESVSKVLYLDGDIVVNGSLKDLYQLNIDDVYIAGVKDTANIFEKAHCRIIGIPDDVFYFNAGVALMNIDRMRRDNIYQAFFTFLRENIDILKANDQDVLNGTLHKAVRYISPVYNYNYWVEKDIALQLFSEQEIEAVKNNPVIVHYIGPVKPWNYKSIHPKKALWWNYLKQTPFKDYRPTDKNLKNMVSFFFLTAIIKPVKPLLTVGIKRKAGKLLPEKLKKRIKKLMYNAQ